MPSPSITEKCVVLSPSPVERDLGGQVLALGVAFVQIDARGQLPGVVLAGQVLGDLDEVLVAEVAGAIAVGAAHGLDQQVQRFGRPAALLLQVEVFEDVEHLDQADAARAGRRRSIDVVAAIGAVDRLAGLGPVARPGPPW